MGEQGVTTYILLHFLNVFDEVYLYSLTYPFDYLKTVLPRFFNVCSYVGAIFVEDALSVKGSRRLEKRWIEAKRISKI